MAVITVLPVPVLSTVTCPWVAPAGTVIAAGKLTTLRVLAERATVNPPAGAGSVRETVRKKENPCPERIEVGVRLTVGSGRTVTWIELPSQLFWFAWTESAASRFWTVSGAATVKLAELAPSGIATVSGTEAAAGSVLVRSALTPPAGAGNGMVMVTLPLSRCLMESGFGASANCGSTTVRVVAAEVTKLPGLTGSGFLTLTPLAPASDCIGTVALRAVAEMNWVARGAPSSWTSELAVKFSPVSWMVTGDWLAKSWLGTSVTIFGTRVKKTSRRERATPGLNCPAAVAGTLTLPKVTLAFS